MPFGGKIEITVIGDEQFDRLPVRVSEDGKINIPYLNEVIVEGLTAIELEQTLARLLSERFIVNPQVTIAIVEHRSRVVKVSGAVGSPGVYELLGRARLVEMLIQAGGIAPEAGPELFVIREGTNGNFDSRRISVLELFEQVDMVLNIPLEPNDIIHVPIDRLVPIYVGGEVGSPGVFEVRMSSIPSLLQAIIQAGGFAERANKKKVILKRIGQDGREVRREYNVKDIIDGKMEDVALQARDVVYVTRSVF